MLKQFMSLYNCYFRFKLSTWGVYVNFSSLYLFLACTFLAYISISLVVVILFLKAMVNDIL